MKRLSVLLILAAAACAAAAQDSIERIYGYAYHLDSGRYAFTEVLEQRKVAGRWVGGGTTYYRPDGREMGRKTTDFTRDPFVPVFRFDLASGYAEGITDNGPVITMVRASQGRTETATAQRDGLTTADSGLPRLLHAHFPELLGGAELKIRVVAPSRLDTFRFRARHGGATTFENRPAVLIRVDLDSLLKLFAGPLFFTFDPASGKLLEFRGMTNVHNPETGDPYRVRISYYSTPPADVPVLPPLPR